ncbi:hypothetical protein DPMN_089232 [Dreissena polymorpha]|uniref:Uncharacterized protein n=1 Tax=Dreissena polymorpha TaxID=45954 RepID=A0A9D4KW03_DREPO|nr:hypothetical protein DPMN_089232 [Dreissena polymorpha]
MTRVHVAHGMYPVRYHAIAQEEQPVRYQLTHGVESGQYHALTRVPDNMLVGGQVQLIDSVIQPQLTGGQERFCDHELLEMYQLTRGVQYGQYQTVTRVPEAHRMYLVQDHAIAQEEQPVQYQFTYDVKYGQ